MSLRFKLYTAPCTRLADELLAAAEQYQLELLKSICEERLCATLEIGNSVRHLVLGDMYQAAALKRMAMQFVVRNMSSVVRSRDWKESLLDHPGLMAEVGLTRVVQLR